MIQMTTISMLLHTIESIFIQNIHVVSLPIFTRKPSIKITGGINRLVFVILLMMQHVGYSRDTLSKFIFHSLRLLCYDRNSAGSLVGLHFSWILCHCCTCKLYFYFCSDAAYHEGIVVHLLRCYSFAILATWATEHQLLPHRTPGKYPGTVVISRNWRMIRKVFEIFLFLEAYIKLLFIWK